MNDEARDLATELWNAHVDEPARRIMHGAVDGYRIRDGVGTACVLGGVPDGGDWPRRSDGTPLTLLATLDLGLLHPTARGMLQLWCDVEEPGWEADCDRDDYLVRVVPEDAPSPSVPDRIEIVPRTTSALVETRFAPSPSLVADGVLDVVFWELYEGWLADLPPGPDHRVLGACAPVQGDVEEECPHDDHPWAAPAEEWMLLLQLDSDPELGWMWGDMGMLYWMIRRDDWAAGRFDRVFLVMQCG